MLLCGIILYIYIKTLGEIMNTEYRERLSYGSAMWTLALLALIFSIISLTLSDIFVPVSAAFLSVMLLCEKKRGKRFSYFVPCAIAALNAAVFVCAFFTKLLIFTVAGLEIIAVSFFLYVLFSKNIGKGETVGALSVTFALFLTISLWLTAADATGSFSLTASLDFYKAFAGELKDVFIESVAQMTQGLPSGTVTELYNEQTAAVMFDTVISVLPAIGIIFTVIMTGFLCKLFSFVVFKITGNTRIFEWRFITSSLLAYFYCALFVVNLLASGSDSVFSVVVMNLYLVFMVIYAYLGFQFSTALISMRRTRGFAWTLIALAVVIASAFAAIILSFVGVVYVVFFNRSKRKLG